jgi:hypothetical protein
MSDAKEVPSMPQDLPSEYYEIVGRVASDWAGLEYCINEAIWMTADVSPALGACMTAQIFNINGRLIALVALLKERGANGKLINPHSPNEMAFLSAGSPILILESVS